MQATEEEKTVRKPKGSGLPNDLRELQKLAEALADNNPFVKKEADKLMKKVNQVLETNRLRESQWEDDKDGFRANFNRFTGGKAEKIVRDSDDEDMKIAARKMGWRV